MQTFAQKKLNANFYIKSQIKIKCKFLHKITNKNFMQSSTQNFK